MLVQYVVKGMDSTNLDSTDLSCDPQTKFQVITNYSNHFILLTWSNVKPYFKIEFLIQFGVTNF
jgi:hypothetical protein